MSNFPPSSPMGSPNGPPPKRGMSTGVKVLLILLIVFGVFAVICCGFGGLMAYYFKGAFSEDPAVVKRTTTEITDINVPASLHAMGSINLPGIMTMAIYGDKGKSDGNSLVLAGFGNMMRNQDQEQMRQQIEQSLRQQGMQQQRGNKNFTESQRKTLQIRGQPATFTINKGHGPGGERIQVIGIFEGKTGPAMLMLEADTAKISEEQAVQMLESIH